MTFSEFAESFLHQEELRFRLFMLSCPLRSRLLHMYEGLLSSNSRSQPKNPEQPAESSIDNGVGKRLSPGDYQRVIDEVASRRSDGQLGDAPSRDATSLAYLFVGILTK